MSPKVCLAISAFQSDAAVAALLEQAAALVPDVFWRVLVVDSLGTSRIARLIQARGWTWVTYHCSDINLGSAGNLARRLELAAKLDADFVYALNHDGHLSGPDVVALVEGARTVQRLGAAYPLRLLSKQDNRYDVTGVSRLLFPTRSRTKRPNTGLLDVYWGSSNGTLYALEPVRSGLLPWSDLWMGWEDLGYGLLLNRHGYRQVVVCDSVFRDSYEFKSVGRALGKSLYVAHKPSWYSYYNARNLILIGRRLNPRWDTLASFGCRLAIESVTTLLFRPEKKDRLRLMVRGIADGAFGRSGKCV